MTTLARAPELLSPPRQFDADTRNISILDKERIACLEALVSQATAAAAAFKQFTQEDVDRIVKSMVLAGLEHAHDLARLAIEETRLGVLEDKFLKNMVATEFVYNYVKDKRTVGVIREFPDRGLVEVAEPIGVILSMTPIGSASSTRPRSGYSWITPTVRLSFT